MKYGDCTEQMIRMRKRSGKPVDINPPELFPDLQPTWAAFCVLSGSRNMNGRIPVSEITAYGKENGVRNLREFIDIIQALDSKAAELREEEQERKRKHGS